jgi:peptidoglycan L-alanyl-D-glutamate endopeptidase CwlK
MAESTYSYDTTPSFFERITGYDFLSTFEAPSFGGDALSPEIRSSSPFSGRDDILLLDPAFVGTLGETLHDLREQGYHDVAVADGFRTPEQQREKVIQGFSAPGSETFVHRIPGRHMGGRAADVVLRRYGWQTPGGKEHRFWLDLGRAAERRGLVWGGRWRSRDVAHIEMR